MTPQDLFEQFETLAEALDGAERLREFVLRLAVRGLLVPQVPSETPASIALEGIASRRDEMIESGAILKPRFPEGVLVEDPPHQIPSTWKWVRLADIGAVVGGGTPKSKEPAYWATGEEVPWITPADMRRQTSRWITRGERDITREGLESSSARLLPAGTVLFSSRAPIGHVGIAACEITTNQGFKSCVPYVPEMSEYIYWFLRYAGKGIDAAATGTTFKEVSGKEVALVPIPVPPVSEQKRICQRVDQLMELISELEVARSHRHAVRVSLRSSALDALQSAEDPDELVKAWARVRDNMDDLIAEPEDVDSLRQTILQLAVRGRLVPQDPADEPASVLLERIAVEKARLVKDGKIRKPKPLPPIDPNEVPFEIPAGWEWVKLGYLGRIGSSKRVHQRDWDAEGVPFYRAREIVRLSKDGFVQNELFISAGLFDRLSSEGLAPQPSDVMITGVGTIGVPYVVRDDDVFYFKDASVLIFKNDHSMCAEFLRLVMSTPYWNQVVHRGSMGTTVHTLTIKRAVDIPVPIPPRDEQERIVQGVGSMLAQCNDLEKRLTDKRTAHEFFAECLSNS